MRRRSILRRRFDNAPSALLKLLGVAVALISASAFFLPRPTARPAPDVAFTLLDGGSASLRALRGRPVLISFWATTCAICVAEQPELAALYRELHPLGLEMIGVAMPYDPPIQVQDFVRTRDVPFPIALDVQGQATRAFAGVSVTPTAFLLDPDGNIVFSQVGKLDTGRVRRIIVRQLETGAGKL